MSRVTQTRLGVDEHVITTLNPYRATALIVASEDRNRPERAVHETRIAKPRLRIDEHVITTLNPHGHAGAIGALDVTRGAGGRARV